MDRWLGQVAVVTGASSGIGAAIVEELVNYDLKVVGLARRKELLDKLSEKFEGKFYGIKADITKEEDILHAFNWIKENLGGVSILVNNAGIAKRITLINGATSDFKNILDTSNVLGLTIATREALQSMRNNNVDGHIIHVNSVVGHYVPHIPNFNVYPASKHAVTALTETLRQELNSLGSKIKITSVSPGLVETDMYASNKYPKETLELLKIMPKLNSKDVADAVIYILGTPAHVQISELIIRPVGEIP